MQFDTWLLFLLACAGLSLAPGPNSLLALTHGALYGWRKTFYTIVGGSMGFVFLIALSMFGIGALVRASLGWLTVLQWVGSAYLVWLGIVVWRAPPLRVDIATSVQPASHWSLLRQGALAAATNPKGLLFFSSFLPHFIDPARSMVTQFVVMAATFIATEVFTEALLATTAHRIRPWLARVGSKFNKICGGLFVLIAAMMSLRT